MILRTKISELDENLLERKQIDLSRNEMKNQIIDLELKKQHLESQLQDIYHESQCLDDESFLQRIQQSKERNELQRQYELLGIQLRPYEEERKKWEEYPNKIINDYSIRLLEEEKNECDRHLNQCIQQITECKHKIVQLEDGGTYVDKSFQFFTEKSALMVEAKEWMKFALAKGMLQKAVNIYKNSKFPQILHIAEKYLMAITDGEYIRIQWKEDAEGLVLQRKDGLIFEASEVSRGTQEAIYVSLRLSLAQQSYNNESMPIIIDDSFVNFDRTRVEKVLTILQSLKNTHQIIFFTCHDYLLPYFEENHITKLDVRNTIKN